MEEETLNRILQILKKRRKKLRPYFSRKETDCYRLFSGTVDEGLLTVDLYGASLHISLSPAGEEKEHVLTGDETDRIARALYIQPDKVILKSRQKLQEHRQYTALKDRRNYAEVHENGLSFLVNLEDYIDTGLFLDHRKTRQMVREECFGKTVLNLFAYTGSFSVYAAAGGAREITTVDLSSSYLEWGKNNFRINNLLPGAFEFVQADASTFLEDARKNERQWDLIILDPPTFSNSRKMEGTWKIQKDHAEMIRRCGQVLSQKGTILFSTNYRQFRLEEKLLPGFSIEEITPVTRDEDFTAKDGHRCWRMTYRKTGQRSASGHPQSAGRASSSRKRRPSSGSQRKRKS